uniref:Curculin domain protein (Mannose-binding) lectin n=1 Tax=Solibacter usitatus (strain Ellin6076) TaxID=234267 RepID=Q01RL0_SOLUE
MRLLPRITQLLTSQNHTIVKRTNEIDMRRLLIAAACLIIPGLTGAAAYAAGGSNSAAAALCQKGGYVNLTRADFSNFSNTGECVSYAAKGGKLVPIRATLVLTESTSITTPKCWEAVGPTGVTPTGTALWNSGTFQHEGASLCFQADGNLVIYEAGHVGDPAYAPWDTKTYNNPGAFLAFQGDGNLVIYTALPNPVPLWSSGTSGHPSDCVIFQGDGNLVIYPGCTKP